ncbi:hypothetical protein [Pseudomonas sp. HY7a-MNA-CIBAN-0227]|uniref:hypothetical protein n=1 Tax=Pseudomonas sp. HY7a-MNA-CIBAN-0227 TaxID=3140474 RepID=UPI0033323F20
MPENLTHSLSFFQRACEKKSIYDHFISRNPDILGTVIKATSEGLFSIESVLKEHGQNTAECGNYEYTILNDDKHIIKSEIFGGVFNSIMIANKIVIPLFIYSNDTAIDLDKTEIIDESKFEDQDYRLFGAIKLVIESIQQQVDTNKIKVALKSFLDSSYQEKEVTPEPNQQLLDKRAFDLILYEEDPELLRSAEYLVKAMLEIAKDDLAKKSTIHYASVTLSKDNMLNNLAMVIETQPDIIYTLDSITSEFHSTNRISLKNISADEFQGSDKETLLMRTVEQLLLTIDGKIEASDFFNDLIVSRS